MSRSGTLQDALRSVDEFQKSAALRHTRAKLPVADGDAQEDKQDRERRHSRKKLEKDGRRKSKSYKERRRRKELKREEDDDENSDEDDDGAKEERRAERKKKNRREHRKKESKSSSRRSDRKMEKKSSRRREKDKQQPRRLRSPQDHSSSSEDEDSVFGSKSSESEDIDSPLRAEQVAAGIVEEFPEVKEELLQLLQMVDTGQAVDISGLPNKRLIELLQKLFQSLHMKKSKAGLYLLSSGSQPTLERLGRSLQVGTAEAQGKSGKAEGIGPGLRPLLPIEKSSERNQEEASQGDGKHSNTVSPPEVAPIGDSQMQKRRIIGPAMPSAEMLEAAAKLTEAEEALRAAEAALEDDPMIGPPPPSAVAEASSANDAERFEEVTRIMAPEVGDAYELLRVKREVTAGDLKKRYWKLSLLVHPDKCSHPQAHEAFMALNKAFKDLQDPLRRAEIDRKADQKAAKEEYEADLKAKREAAQWRRLRGEEALPGDAELLQGDVKAQARDEWMTVLPPERQAGKIPSQHNTFFSRSEKSGRGDTSVWTDTPLQKAQKAKMQYLEAYNQAALTGPEQDEMSTFEKDKAAKAAALIDQYNQKKRSLSLVEEHQQKIAKESKKAKKKKKKKDESQDGKQPEWAETHPWKPWDRERDLAAGRQTMKWGDVKSAGEGLGSRFGSSGGQRKFL